MIYIIADDLTGANDTGVQFSKQGYTTHVMIVPEGETWDVQHTERLPQNVDVLVIDTETREADATTARKRIQRVLEVLQPEPDDIVYKKIDSTLRGQIGVELDECLHLLQKDICLVTPSFPQAKRITVGGYLLVQDQPLGLSEYYNGDLTPEDASFIPSLLQADTQFRLGRIDLHDVIQGRKAILAKMQEHLANGRKIIVIDAMNDTQLQNILLSAFEFQGSVLYSGSAGLANSLSEIYNGQRHVSDSRTISRSPVVIVSGTRRSIAQSQIEYLKEKLDIEEITITLTHILSKQAGIFERYINTIIQAIQAGRHLVIHPECPSYSQNNHHDELQRVLTAYHMDFRTLELIIRNYLGELVATVAKNVTIKNLILTGGDTAIGVCSALHITNLHIIEELLPGIPLSTGGGEKKTALNVVTKAGGFGEEDTLYQLIEKLEHIAL